MQIVRSIPKMQSLSRRLAANGKRIGLVPTMGFLHDGHLSLIKIAKKHSDIVITTIFINPTQFAPNEDLARYPRDEKGDIAKIGSVDGDIIFIPKADDIYPPDYQTYIEIEKLAGSLEGAVRPGHFRGVATIVAKLFNITRPDIAVFGMKDYQQTAVIKQMVNDLDYPVKIIIAPTVREKDGLAMSSRNKYFTAEERKEAVCLYTALEVARSMIKVERVKDVSRLRREMTAVIKEICPTAKIDYIAFTDFDSLEPMKEIGRNCICSLAVRVHGVRLIDNMKL